MRKFLHFFGIHHYKLDHTVGVNRYWECLICGKRKFDSIDIGYTEPDYTWLLSGSKPESVLPVGEDIYESIRNN